MEKKAPFSESPRSAIPFVDTLSSISGKVAMVALCLMVAVVTFEVIARYIFNSPTFWSVEVSEYLLVTLAFLSLAYVLTQNGHIRLELVYTRFTGKTRKIMECISHFFGVILCAIFVWQGLALAIWSFTKHEIENSVLGTPVFVGEAVMVLGFCIFGLQFIASTLRLIRRSAKQ